MYQIVCTLNCNISVVPLTTGTQQDIDTALAMIRQKFPLRRFPTLTLEKVSFVPTIPVCPLRAEAFHVSSKFIVIYIENIRV